MGLNPNGEASFLLNTYSQLAIGRGLEQQHNAETPTHTQPDLSVANFNGVHRDSYLFADGVKYESRSEKACATLLQKYVKGWTPIAGQSFQIPIVDQKRCDFRVKNTLIEFHVIMLRWEMEPSAYQKFVTGLCNCSAHSKMLIREALIEDYAAKYYTKRRFAIDHSPSEDIRRCKLLCVYNEAEFINKIIIPLSKRKDLIFSELMKEFKKAMSN